MNAANGEINGATVATTGEVRVADKAASLRLLGSAGQGGVTIYPQGSCDVTLNILLSVTGAPLLTVSGGVIAMGSLKTTA